MSYSSSSLQIGSVISPDHSEAVQNQCSFGAVSTRQLVDKTLSVSMARTVYPSHATSIEPVQSQVFLSSESVATDFVFLGILLHPFTRNSS